MNEDKVMYSYSVDDEQYVGQYSTREKALEGALDDEGGYGTTIFTAENVPHTFMDFVFLDTLFGDIHERAVDECGDVADDFPGVSKDAEKELENLIEQWASRHNIAVDFWSVKNIQKHSPPTTFDNPED